MADALLLVDIQNDFLPGGALAVPQGDQILARVVSLLPHFKLVFATQDWHPADHCSFAANHAGGQVGEQVQVEGEPQVLWPVHCVQGSSGAAFASAISPTTLTHTSRKGSQSNVDSYSGFFDNARRQSTDLDQSLRAHHVDHLFICGLATEYCVRFTVLDAASLGYRVSLIVDACRGLDDGDVDDAIKEMRDRGVDIVDARSVLESR